MFHYFGADTSGVMTDDILFDYISGVTLENKSPLELNSVIVAVEVTCISKSG